MVLKNDKQIVIIITAALYNEYKRFQTNQFLDTYYYSRRRRRSPVPVTSFRCPPHPPPPPPSPFPQHNKIHEKGEMN